VSEQSQNPRRPVRRAPNIAAFLITGTLIGLFVGVLLGLQATGTGYSQSTAVALIAVIGAIVGAIVAGVAIALIEYRSLR